VVSVSWLDARRTGIWLARKNVKPLRLMTEAETGVPGRQGRAPTRFPLRYAVARHGNYDGSNRWSGPSDVNRHKTRCRRSFPANAFGLQTCTAMFSEWFEDCWHTSTGQPPADGSAWLEGTCDGRVMRCGSAEDSQEELRSSARSENTMTTRQRRRRASARGL